MQTKTAIVVGAGRPSGIGQAAAIALAAQKHNVVIADMTTIREDLKVGGRTTTTDNFSLLNDRVTEVETLGGKGLAVSVDVTDRAQIQRCIEQTVNKFGGIDILIYNVGTSVGSAPFLKTTDADWDLNYQINLKGAVDFCRAAIPEMQARGAGAIVTTSSQYAVKVMPGESAYVATKAGLIALTKCLAAEFAADNIRCNCVCPGAIDTMMAADHKQHLMHSQKVSATEIEQDFADEAFMQRMGRPDEVGKVIAFLAQDDASFVTGAVIPIDGAAKVGL